MCIAVRGRSCATEQHDQDAPLVTEDELFPPQGLYGSWSAPSVLQANITRPSRVISRMDRATPATAGPTRPAGLGRAAHVLRARTRMQAEPGAIPALLAKGVRALVQVAQTV